MTAEQTNDIENRFGYHPPAGQDEIKLHENIRANMKTTAHWLSGELPSCRELSLAITHLEEAMMWANAAVARHISAPKNAEKANS